MPDIFVAKHKGSAVKEKEEKKPSLGKINKINHLKRLVKILTRNSPHHTDDNLKNVELLSAFCLNPIGVSFEEKDKDENILLFLRRHIITNVSWISLSILFLLIPPLVFFVNSQLFSFDISNIFSLPMRFILIFTIFYYSIVLTYIFVNFISWYFNISLITNKRVLDVDFSGLVYKNVSATKLTLLQDASYTQTGVIRSVFDYGDVLLQTAGSLENFDISAVPYPERTVKIVEDLIGREGSGIFK